MDLNIDESYDAEGLTAQWVGAHAGTHAVAAGTPCLTRRSRYQDVASSSDDNDDGDTVEQGASSCLHPAASGMQSVGTELHSALTEAAEAFPHTFGPAWAGAIDVATVQEAFRLPKAQMYGLLDVLEVLEIIVARGKGYRWRGVQHVPMLLTSDKFQVGASVQRGIAVPKVCRTLIPHLVAHEGVPLTAQELADMVWTGQADVEECIAEAEQQQKRALSCYVSDILAVLVGLGYVQPRANEVGEAAFEYVPVATSSEISPKGQLQSRQMRDMRLLFEGPLPTALDDAVAPPAPLSAHRTPQVTPPPPRRTPARAAPRTSPLHSGDVSYTPTDGMWREEPRVPPGGHKAARLRTTPLMVAVPEDDEAQSAQADSPHRRLPGARPGQLRSPGRFAGRNFAGVQTLANMFETTRLSQVAPFRVSKVKSMVREYESPGAPRRAHAASSMRR